MKTLKKLATLSAAVIMAATAAVPATFMTGFAASGGSNTITIESDGLTHSSLNAYQIFAGTAASGGILTNVTWGDGINSDAFLNALKGDTTYGSLFSSCTDAASVANVLAANDTLSNTALAKAFAKYAVNNLSATTSGTSSTGSITGLPDGYYVLADSDAATDTSGNSTWTSGILYVAGGMTTNVTPKTDLAKVEKKVWEDRSGAGWQDVADAEIGQTVTFRLIATLPSNLDEYNQYYVRFNDQLTGTGFESVGNVKAFKVPSTVSDTDDILKSTLSSATSEALSGKGITDVTSYLDTNNTTNITEMQFAFNDVKKETGVNASNSDKIIVEYTAVLDKDAQITPTIGNDNAVNLTYSNNPNVTVDGSKTPSSDNGGSDENPTGETPTDKVRVLTYEFDGTKIESGTDNTLADAEFKIQRSDDNKWATIDSATNTISGWVADEASASTITSASDGKFKIVGLDEGTYKLKETKAPSGYNLPSDPFNVVISSTLTSEWADFSANPLTSLTLNGSGDYTTTGVVTMNIENHKGSSLPGTGGMGTTIFYVGGGILVVASGALLISKKRMKNKEN